MVALEVSHEARERLLVAFELEFLIPAHQVHEYFPSDSMERAICKGVQCQQIGMVGTDDIADVTDGAFCSSVILNMIKLFLNDSFIHQIHKNAFFLSSIHPGYPKLAQKAKSSQIKNSLKQHLPPLLNVSKYLLSCKKRSSLLFKQLNIG